LASPETENVWRCGVEVSVMGGWRFCRLSGAFSSCSWAALRSLFLFCLWVREVKVERKSRAKKETRSRDFAKALRYFYGMISPALLPLNNDFPERRNRLPPSVVSSELLTISIGLQLIR